MWKSLQLNNIQYYILLEVQPDTVCLTLTDLIYIWKEVLKFSDVIKRFKSCNPKAQVTEYGIRDFIIGLFDTDNTIYELEVAGNFMSLTIGKTLIIKMKFIFNLEKQPAKSVYQEVTLPLLLLVGELKEAQERLYKHLELKDLQLKEFELEGYKITRKNVITPKFKIDEFQKEQKSGLEERLKSAVKNSKMFTEDINKIYPALKSVVSSLETTTPNPSESSCNGASKEETGIGRVKKSAEKRQVKNEDNLLCKRVKVSKKIII